MSEPTKVQNKSTRCKISGMWKQTTKAGVEYWTGSTEEGVRFTLFPNGYKTAENHPDFILYTDMPDNDGKIEKGTRAVVAVTDLQAPVKRA